MASLRWHFRAVHKDVPKLRCEYSWCKYETIYSQGLEIHLKSVHQRKRTKAPRRIKALQDESKLMKCSHCDFKTMFNHQLKLHIKAIHEKIKDVVCKICHFATTHKCVLVKHMRRKHSQVVSQIDMDKKVQSPSILKFLQKDVSDKDTSGKENIVPSQEECKRAHSEAQTHNVATPTKVVQPEELPGTSTYKKLTSLKDMENSEYDKISLKENISSTVSKAEDEKDSSTHCCNRCSYITTSVSSLRRHFGEMHGSKEEKNCPYCDYSTKHDGLFERHVKLVHEEKKDHVCPTCGYKSNQLTNLKKHIKSVHEKVRDRKCDICGYATADKSTLNKHMEKHNGDDKRVQCKECQKWFKSDKILRGHNKTFHSNAPKHKCSFCEFETAQPAGLRTHIKAIHEKIKDKVCKICDFATPHSHVLTKHIRRAHSDVK